VGTIASAVDRLVTEESEPRSEATNRH